MENKLHQLKKETEHIRLSPDTKTVFRERLISFMKTHPIDPVHSAPRTSPFTFSAFIFNARFTALAVIAFLILGSTTAFASEKALPGETLYPIKISIESIQEKLLTDPPTRVAFAIERAERRLAEAEQLASEGVIDEATHAEIAVRFEQHLQTLAEIKPEHSDTDADANLEATLAVHETILTSLQQTKRAPLKKLIARVQTERTMLRGSDRLTLDTSSTHTLPTVATLKQEASIQDDAHIRSDTSFAPHAAPEKEPEDASMMMIEVLEERDTLVNKETATQHREKAVISITKAREELREKESQNLVSKALLEEADVQFKRGEKALKENGPENASEYFIEADALARKSMASIRAQKRVRFMIDPALFEKGILETHEDGTPSIPLIER